MAFILIHIFPFPLSCRSHITDFTFAFHARWIGFAWQRTGRCWNHDKKAPSEKNESCEKNAFFMSLLDAINRSKGKRAIQHDQSTSDLFGDPDDDSLSIAELQRSIENESPKAMRSEEEAFQSFYAEKAEKLRPETRDEEHTERVLRYVWSQLKLQQTDTYKSYFEPDKSSSSDVKSTLIESSLPKPKKKKGMMKPLEEWNSLLIDMIIAETGFNDIPRTPAEKIALIREHIPHV